MTSLTLERDVGHKLHFDRDPSLAFALLAATSLLIEREMGWCVTHLLRQRLFGKEFPYFFIRPDVCDGIRSRTFPDRILIYELYVLDMLHIALDSETLHG